MATEPEPVEQPGERYEQETFRKPEQIDKEKGEMYGVRVMGLQSAHGYAYTLDAHKGAAKHFEQMAVGIDHDYSGGPLTSENAWGVFHNVRVDDKGTVADLRFLQSHPRTPQVLEDIERDLGLFSFSPVTTRNVERPAGSVVSFVPVRCDLVVRGATTKRVFEQADNGELAAVKAEVAAMAKELADLRSRQTVYEQTIAPGAAEAARKAAEQSAAAKGIDLKAFWNHKE